MARTKTESKNDSTNNEITIVDLKRNFKSNLKSIKTLEEMKMSDVVPAINRLKTENEKIKSAALQLFEKEFSGE